MDIQSLINIEGVADEIRNITGNESFRYKKFDACTLKTGAKPTKKYTWSNNGFRKKISEILLFGHNDQNNKKQQLQNDTLRKINDSTKFKLAPAQIEHCNLVLIQVSRYFNIPIRQLMCKTRANARAARARQIAIYFAHTIFSVTYKEAATFFQRDRTTIAYACRMIEDKRDNQYFDEKLSIIENLLKREVEYENQHEYRLAGDSAILKNPGVEGCMA